MLPSQSSPLLKKQGIEISSRGELVVVRIGNVDLPMHYTHAIDLSRWIRDEARIIKRACGRMKTIRSLGTAHDADARAKPIPNHKPGIHVKERLQAWRREDVSAKGRLVSIKIGPRGFDIHYESALRISQWLRLRAKEAKARAGDTERHWSVIGAAQCE